jgi:hypothetical protein
VRGGGGGFGGGILVTRSSSGGDDIGGDILEHREVNWGVRHRPKEKDKYGVAELTKEGEKRQRRHFSRPMQTRGRGDGGEARCALFLERGAEKGEWQRWGDTLLKGARRAGAGGIQWGATPRGERRRGVQVARGEGGGATDGRRAGEAWTWEVGAYDMWARGHCTGAAAV